MMRNCFGVKGPRCRARGGRRWHVHGRVRHRHDRRGRLRSHPLHRRHRRLDRQGSDEHHHPRAEHQCLSGEAGAVTVEAAFAIAALVAVLVLCLAGLTAVAMQVRCIDAAREAARLAARGDDGAATRRSADRRAGGCGPASAARRGLRGRDRYREITLLPGSRSKPKRWPRSKPPSGRAGVGQRDRGSDGRCFADRHGRRHCYRGGGHRATPRSGGRRPGRAGRGGKVPAGAEPRARRHPGWRGRWPPSWWRARSTSWMSW